MPARFCPARKPKKFGAGLLRSMAESRSSRQVQARIAGTVDLVDCTGPHPGAWQYKDKTYRYILKNPVKFKKPKPYKHPKGAVIWVNLDSIKE
jgi:hypothetical protein